LTLQIQNHNDCFAVLFLLPFRFFFFYFNIQDLPLRDFLIKSQVRRDSIFMSTKPTPKHVDPKASPAPAAKPAAKTAASAPAAAPPAKPTTPATAPPAPAAAAPAKAPKVPKGPKDGAELIKGQVRVTLKNSKYTYVDLVKYLLHEGEPVVELSGLGPAIVTVVEIVETLKAQGLVATKDIETGRLGFAARLAMRVVKTAEFDGIFAKQQEEKKAGKKVRSEAAAPAAV
jgi:hypothetical protein